MVHIVQIAPQEIEAESFRIIEDELGPTSFSKEEFAVVRRIIHATGDLSFAEIIKFHPEAVSSGLRAIRAGRDILVDVNMAASGISKKLLAEFGGKVICRVAEPETYAYAREHKVTRSDAAITLAAQDNIGIVAVGNAPTALLKTMELIERGLLKPDLVIGTAVGFVNAAESKELLALKEYPYIVVSGRKGGTGANVAAVNALLHLA
ncbi:MAG: precorrin-8X methylmutase [Desulfobulbus propionicus]|nr:MAG: precorrin-8X methylmutase [Desulfobulbus propionicus]